MLGIAAQGALPDLDGSGGVTGNPQDFAQVGGDLGVGECGVGLVQIFECFRLLALSIQSPTHTVQNGRLIGLQFQGAGY